LGHLHHTAKLAVEELRDELRARGLTTTGLKPVLLERLQEALSLPNVPQHRVALQSDSADEKKKGNKRGAGGHKKEPQRDEFASEEEYHLVWTKWRESRDNNNESVKRSRELAKKKRSEQERIHQEREQQNAELEKLVSGMKEEVKFLNKVLKTPELLDRPELAKLEDLLSRGLPPLSTTTASAAGAQ